jgi:hypothetical protein
MIGTGMLQQTAKTRLKQMVNWTPVCQSIHVVQRMYSENWRVIKRK